ncbi:ganglioside-induced differentiation-associated protein 1-like isoform X2 [Sinocyclocheilus anshuiensis]|uniref:ganglioside-induced differentiation-associated protein 1-like isoform X2 n=1 Tax=Sinocyclocheilus anshuiensis TaxID=1608454 RepID=UPI0007BA12FA|nr:PREDICTED: ganglioside-induced differentiation-associated protein 1-like isoform X2 [Sinocyclocheilus anshuiensis]
MSDKMAVENIGESQDEKESLIKKDALSQDSGEFVEKTKNKESKLILYHWTQSFSSQKVRLAIAEKGLQCEEYDVSLPLSEHNEPWFMRLNPTGEVPVLVHNDNVICDPTQIMDYLEQNFCDAQILNTESELKKLAAENPDLKDAYIAKQRRLKSKLFDHDNMKYLKKLLDELENVLDQVETELQRRIEETPEEGSQQAWLCGDFFSIADVSLAVTLHRLKFLGLSRRFWGNGTRVNLEMYYERVLNRPAFRRVLGHVNNILISAVLPTAFRVAKKKAPAFVGATLLVGLIGGATYLAFTYFKRRLLMS